jgi:uncharacterized protein with HEPN domain
MSERNVRILIDGIISSIDRIFSYTNGLDYSQFRSNQMVMDAVLMQLMVLGEHANRIPKDFRKILPDIEWGRIVRSRNIIAHEYHGIDYEIIWRIVIEYLPPLKTSLETKLKELE